MSGISKNIRKITEAWGGKTTGSGIGDAVMDLYNSLPFYSEKRWVEVVPEQTFSYEEYIDDLWFGNFSLKEGSAYNVVLNGKDHVIVCEFDNENGVYVVEGPGLFLSTFYGESGTTMCILSSENVALAIYEEKEVVNPIDPKWLAPVFYVHSVYDEDTKLRYENDEEVSIKDVLKYGLNILICDTDTSTMFRPHCLHKTDDADHYSYGYMDQYLSMGDDNYVKICYANVGTKPNVKPV